MRAALLIMIALGASAHAEGRIVAMTDDASASALELTLAHAHIAVTVAPVPEGALALDRAAAAQRSVLGAGATAGVWIEDNDVCVVAADGSAVRRTPLPAGATPRVFAAIAASLLDELNDTPEHVDVHLDAGPMPELAPGSAAVIAAVGSPSPRWSRTLVEVGLTLSPASYGVEVELALPLTPHLRAGLIGGLGRLYDGLRDDAAGTPLYDAAAELRYVGDGDSHFDVGIGGGVINGTTMDGDGDTGGFVALRLSYVRELATNALSFSIAPMQLFDFRGQGNDRIFGVMTSIKVGLPI